MKRINIMLGTACNWRCPYCIQQDETTIINHKPDIEYFCDQLSRYLSQNKVDVKRVAYWGGEPLLYWDYITEIEDRAIRPHGTSLPSRIITNGSLIESKHIKWFNSHHSLVNVSYHVGQLSDDQWDKALRITNLYVTSLISHQCTTWEPFRAKWLDIWKRYGRCINWFVYPIRSTGGVPSEWELTKQDVDDYIQYIRSIVPYAANDPFYRRMIEILFYSLTYHQYNDQYYSYCYNDSIISVDLFGNLYYCHHDCRKSNIVDNLFNRTLANKNKTIFIQSRTQTLSKCNDCPAYKFCLGGCFRDQTFDVSCYYTLKMLDVVKMIKRQYPSLIDSKYSNLI